MVDTGNLVDVLFWDAFQRMGIDKDGLKPIQTSLVRLIGHRVEMMDTIYLTLIVRDRCARVDTN